MQKTFLGRIFRRVLFRLQALLRHRRLEKEMDEELRAHFELEVDQNIRLGMNAEEARRAATLAFGSVDAVKEECRDSWGLRFFEMLAQDLRFGRRSLARSPVYAAAVVLTLGIGIGATTAVFGAVRGVLLRPLPFEHGERIVKLQQSVAAAGSQDLYFSVKEVQDYREQNQTLDGLAEYHGMSFLLVGTEPMRVEVGVVSADFFDIFGVRPVLGRTFRAGEDRVGSEPVLVLSHAFWRRSMGGDPKIVGRTFRMNDRVHTVVGILPPLPEYPGGRDVYITTSACPFRSRTHTVEDRRSRNFLAFARLRAGVTIDRARADLHSIQQRLRRAHPEAYAQDSQPSSSVRPLQDELVNKATPMLLILLGIVGFLLLLVCVNVANLTLARLGERGREFAVRQALGAGRGRIVQQLSTESVLLSLAGGVLALAFAAATQGVLIRYVSNFTPRASEIRLDAGVLLFLFCISSLTGIGFGLLRTTGFETLARGLGGGVRATASPRRTRLRSILVVCQLALSVVLLVGAGLMLRSFAALRGIDAGFRSQSVLAVQLELDSARYFSTKSGHFDFERFVGFYDALLAGVRGLPNVTATGTAMMPPLSGAGWTTPFRIEGKPAETPSPPNALIMPASAGYFQALGVTLIRGRYFEEKDLERVSDAMIIDRLLARRHLGGRNPIGARISLDEGESWRTIVGVVGEVRQAALDRDPVETAYVPFTHFPGLSSTLFVHTVGDPATVAPVIRALVRRLDPGMGISDVRTLEQIRDASTDSPRLTATLLGILAALALLISATGVAGVTAYAVSKRAHELAIRLALGAERRRVLGMIMKENLGATVAGIGLGLAAAFGLSRFLSALLFGVGPTDLSAFAGAAMLLLAVAAAASFIPARRVTRIDPMSVLRSE